MVTRGARSHSGKIMHKIIDRALPVKPKKKKMSASYVIFCGMFHYLYSTVMMGISDLYVSLRLTRGGYGEKVWKSDFMLDLLVTTRCPGILAGKFGLISLLC